MTQFFTYILLRGERVAKIGKGSVASRTEEAVKRYYEKRRYSYFGDSFCIWHSTESAAFKAETRMIDVYADAAGWLPPRNERRGGGGGRVYPRCKGFKGDGSRCMNTPLDGNYGFCGVHR